MKVRDKLPWRRIETDQQLDERAQRLSQIVVNRVTASFVGQGTKPAEAAEIGIGPLPRGQDLRSWLGRVGTSSDRQLLLDEPVVSFSFEFDEAASLDKSRHKHLTLKDGWEWRPNSSLTLVFRPVPSEVEQRHAEIFGGDPQVD